MSRFSSVVVRLEGTGALPIAPGKLHVRTGFGGSLACVAQVEDDDLEEAFRPFGTIVSLHLPLSRAGVRGTAHSNLPVKSQSVFQDDGGNERLLDCNGRSIPVEHRRCRFCQESSSMIRT